jgi:endonuclease III
MKRTSPVQSEIDIDSIYQILKREFGTYHMPVVDLIQQQTKSPFKVLVTTILSARSRDETTTAVATRLFEKIKKPDDFRHYTVGQMEHLIFPIGFYRNKARFLHSLPDALDALYGGAIPDTVDELVRLPGVGRKTANLVVAVAFGKPAICVDVHVHRICNRLGYIRTSTPLETEMTLRKKLPVKYWITINSYMVSFGQHTCFPRNPRCDRCPIRQYCRRVNVVTKYF